MIKADVSRTVEDLDGLMDEVRALRTPTPLVPREPVGARAPKIRYSHDALVDLVIAHPEATQNWLAEQFGYSAPWISTIMTSDAWLARLAERRKETVDPILVATIEHRFKAVVSRSLAIIEEKLAGDPKDIPDQLALQSLQIASRAAGFGARETAPPPPPMSVHFHLEELKGGLTRLLRKERGIEVNPVHEALTQDSPGDQR